MIKRIILKMFFGLPNRSRLSLVLVLTVLTSSLVVAQETGQSPILLHAARVFDGNNIVGIGDRWESSANRYARGI